MRATGRLRLPDWPEKLADLVEARRYAPFRWGTHDCAMFAADAVLAMTGADPLARWRGAYATGEEGDAITDPAGGFEPFMAAAFAAFGAPDCDPRLAQRGDVALVSYGNARSLGVVLGGMVAVPGMDRLAFVQARGAFLVRAWAI
jgi:hypothetical protein